MTPRTERLLMVAFAFVIGAAVVLATAYVGASLPIPQ